MQLYTGEHKTLAISASQRNNNVNDKKAKIKVKFIKTGAETTLTAENYISVMNLVPVPKKPEHLYKQKVGGVFEELGSGQGSARIVREIFFENDFQKKRFRSIFFSRRIPTVKLKNYFLNPKPEFL